MEDIKKIQFNYSLKDIPLSHKKDYIIRLYDATSKFINRLRWKMFFINKEIEEQHHKKDEDVFKSSRSAPTCDELKPFETDLYNVIKNIKFNSNKSKFQTKLKKDLNKLLIKNKIILFADKTRNLYHTKPEFYNKLLLDNITKTYKICKENLVEIINSDSQKTIQDRNYKNKKIPKFTNSDAFITIKDHKKQFPNNIECRLLNPGKNHIGKISKAILERIVNEIKFKSKLIQWKNSHEVVDWFNNIKHKANKCFVNFDIVNFYPSIKHHHLKDAIEFAKNYINIKEEDIKLIEHTCQNILTHNNNTWVKKDAIVPFDVPMGSFFGAELCDLIGLYTLNKLKPIYNNYEIGLYRDDGLAIINVKNNQELERIKKQTIKIFKDIGFKITIDIGATSCNFLDIALDIANNEYKPYHKEKLKIKYIDQNSNHPYIIKKNLPTMIQNRIIKLSKNEKIFNESVSIYQEALTKSNFKHKLKYTEDKNTKCKKTRNRKRKVIFFNPPFCQSVKTNIGKLFLKLIEKHFKDNTKLNRIINKNNCKISYSCMPNIKSIIQKHNKRTMNTHNKTPANNTEPDETKLCNCRKSNECPLENKCQVKNVIYKATVVSNKETKYYIGSTGNTFKNRWYGHNNNIKNNNENGTELSKYIWKLKNNNINYKIKWSIVHHIGEARRLQRICSTCNLEKMEIAKANRHQSLNKRYELFATCPHFKNMYFKT